MSDKSKKAPESSILDLWGSTAEERNAANLQLNFRMLKTKGNEHIITLQSRVLEANRAYSDVQLSAKKTPNFSSIASAHITAQASQLELDKAVETYTEIFGETPKLD